MASSFKKMIMMANQIDDGNDADYPPYLCFQALESDFSVCLGGGFHDHVCQYSFNRKDWVDLLPRTYTPAIGILQKVYFRANLTPVPLYTDNALKSIGIFSTTKKCRLSGNPTSMLHGLDWTVENYDISVPSYGLASLFQNAKPVSVSEDFFNVKSTSFRSCYFMFYGSEHLKGPILINNIGTLGNGAFSSAFFKCSIDEITITNANLSVSGFSNAFSSTNIKKISLPATYIYYGAYANICENCVNLEEVFINGRSLNISDTNTNYVKHLAKAFLNCPNLSKVTYLVTDPFAKKYTNDWLTGVAEEGEIILNKFITWNPEDYRNGNIDNIEGSETFGEEITWGIPANWEVKYCDPDNIDDVRDYREIDKAWD